MKKRPWLGQTKIAQLDQGEQRKTLKVFMNHLNPGGAILLTIGHVAGEVLGHVEGQEVYHSSLDLKEYESMVVERSTGPKFI